MMSRAASNSTASRLSAALAARSRDIAVAILGEPNRALSSKREFRFGRKGSLAVVIVGPRAGLWHDHEIGQGGDLLDLIRRHRGGDFKEALRDAAALVGASLDNPAPRPPQPQPAASDKERTRRALALWHEAKPIAGTLAVRYLASRGIVELPGNLDALRFHPACPFRQGERHPCLLGLMVNPQSNEPRAVQRTALTADGKKRERKALGPKAGACIKLSPDDSVELGLAIGEGVETTLAGMMLGYKPAWACGDAGNVAGFPVLAGIDALTILVDHDDAGQRAAAECAARWTAAGCEVIRINPRIEGADINDLLEGNL
jgi:putative DNA primase/helicase